MPTMLNLEPPTYMPVALPLTVGTDISMLLVLPFIQPTPDLPQIRVCGGWHPWSWWLVAGSWIRPRMMSERTKTPPTLILAASQ